MKKQILALAIAGALAVPQVGFAAEDDSGMQYTSASEGLFGSLRTIYSTGAEKNKHGTIKADGSVFGYRGSLDLGSGLTGLYHYEQRILSQEGEQLGASAGKVRHNFVGLRGNFGEAHFGSTGAFVSGIPNVTDITANGGGSFVSIYRFSRGIQYISPELNGFQAGGHLTMPDDGDGSGQDSGRDDVTGKAQVGQWALGGKYKVRGFTVGGAYLVNPEEFTNGRPALSADDNNVMLPAIAANKADDGSQWYVSGTYAQDNWKVAAMYGQKNTSDQLIGYGANTGDLSAPAAIGGGNNAPNLALQTGASSQRRNPVMGGNAVDVSALEDETYVSFGGSINVGKVGLAVLHDVGSDLGGVPGNDQTVTALSATYNFTSRSRVYASYIARDTDAKQNEKDEVIIGMRMDF